MRFHTFLLKYGEIGIKGKNRYLFEEPGAPRAGTGGRRVSGV